MVSRFVGAAIGVAIIGSVFAAVQSHQLGDGSGAAAAYDAGARAGYWVTAFVALAARRGRGSPSAPGTEAGLSGR